MKVVKISSIPAIVIIALLAVSITALAQETREMTTTFADVVSGGTVDYRTEYRWIDNDHFTYVAFMDRGDGQFQNVRIDYERQ
jgi:hypothetical protein